ncbi:helix-turn-helix domain-containing protein [Maridesulfovibrio frigidus]|uniref:transcriptional regulator n=1 Tax=Maridesulfovibrio frigidus TaxID=340956 RepID=UPI00068F070D|nr:transcriptional regulator [Maridesulfovibrio frigidus]
MKKDRTVTDDQLRAFLESLTRFKEGVGLGPNATQVQVADKLGIRQSSISDAKRRASMPSEWLLKALEVSGMNPKWIRSGEGAKFLVPSDDPECTVEEKKQDVNEVLEALKKHFPTGTTIEVNYKLTCVGADKEITK